MPEPGLTLAPDEMRRIGYSVVDFLVEHFASQHEQCVTARSDRATLTENLDTGFSPDGRPFEEVFETVRREVFAQRMQVDHPRFFAFVPSPGNFVSAMADALVSGLNIFQGTWLASSGPSAIELLTMDWLRREVGLPESGGGLMLSGGSMANLTALAAARHARGTGTVYFSDQTHSSVDRALRVLGFTSDQIRRLPSGSDFRLPVEALKRAIAEDRSAGRKPFCVIANAGTTNTGAVDPLDELAGLCAAEGLWLHADGAYGAAAVLCEEGRRALAGIERVDSLSLDPHKWLFQPFESGCVLLRDAQILRDAFRIMPDYLQDVHRLREVNFCDYGIQLSRSFRALKLWMSLQVFGVDAFRAAIARGFELAQIAERALRELPDWEIVTPAQMGIVSFRHRGGDRLNLALIDRMFEEGYAFLTSTVLDGRKALRLCTINPRTTDEEMRETVLRLDCLARQERSRD